LIHSMTGYAEKTFLHKTFSIKISIRTLNHRFLDWNYRGAPLGAVEDKLRSLCQQKLHRGRVEVLVDVNFFSSEMWDFRINQDLLNKILSSLDKAAVVAHKNVTFSLENLLNTPHVVQFRRKDFTKEDSRFLEQSFEKTLNLLIKERAREGGEIKRQLRVHAQNIRTLVNQIAKQAKKQPFLIKQKLMERLEDLSHDSSFSESKLAEEASLLAQRYDLTEEIARLKSHIMYLKEQIDSKDPEPVGKKLDFLAQELYREANTLNSKAQDIEVVRKSLALKSEVESIRQQLQNIE
jgi:uncharacterized protein (TIGR00255 family)